MEVWKDITAGNFTPGGDPLWECPNCGFYHCYGIEAIDGPYHECPKCGVKIRYPWEKEKYE